MMHHVKSMVAICICSLAFVVATDGHARERAEARMQDTEGNAVGSVILLDTPTGTLIQARLRDLPPGVHAFHIHEVGSCSPSFEAAGGHFNPEGHNHGFLDSGPPHAGDFPNIHVPVTGELTFEAYNDRIRLDNTLLDGNGAAVVIHGGTDDYRTDPAGGAGARIACGPIK